MTEPEVTNHLVNDLRGKGWLIYSVDMPQMGGGVALRPNDARSKNEKALIPDILAAKSNVLLVIECKEVFDHNDVMKLGDLVSSEYSDALDRIMQLTETSIVRTAIAGPVGDRFSPYVKEAVQIVDVAFEIQTTGLVLVSSNIPLSSTF